MRTDTEQNCGVGRLQLDPTEKGNLDCGDAIDGRFAQDWWTIVQCLAGEGGVWS